jgi:hypothetical protein
MHDRCFRRIAPAISTKPGLGVRALFVLLLLALLAVGAARAAS